MPRLSTATGVVAAVDNTHASSRRHEKDPYIENTDSRRLPVELRPETHKSARRRPTVKFPPPPPIPDPPADILEKLGQRMYRHRDGSLQPTQPPPNPYTVAARRAWQDLCTQARLTGGDKDATEKGISYRYGIGVPWSEHKQYLENMGMEPEVNSDGKWKGFDPNKINPMDDPEHPLHNVILSEHHMETFPPYKPYYNPVHERPRTTPDVHEQHNERPRTPTTPTNDDPWGPEP